MKIYLFFLLFVAIYSCGGHGGYTEELGNYYYRHMGAESSYIYSKYDSYTDSLTNAVFRNVTDYKFNGRYIIVKQIPRKQDIRYDIYGILKQNIKVNDKSKSIDYIDSLALLMSDSIINFDKKIIRILNNKENFYIIENNYTRTLGPYTFKEFQVKRLELKIRDLKFDFENE